jgi:hypothetical protein
MKQRKVYGIWMTDDDINNVRVACRFVNNAFITHLRHTSDNDSVMSVIGTLYHMFEQFEVQQEANEHDKIGEAIEELLKEIK